MVANVNDTLSLCFWIGDMDLELFQELEVKKAWEAYVESDEVATKGSHLMKPHDIGNIATGMMAKPY